MASILYQQIWESPLLQVANDFDNSGSSVSSWPAISNETWATAQDLKTMEDANSMAFGNYTDLECSKLDLYPLQIPQNEEPHACRPSDLSPARRPSYPSSLSTPVLSPASSSSPISITSPVPRNFSPEYFNLERTITPEAETIRAEIKRNPEPFIICLERIEPSTTSEHTSIIDPTIAQERRLAEMLVVNPHFSLGIA
ncbi:hypothetical protein M408DRAFT_25840 [Serendipita vermifera MAFF 305830]|uniref:Uncharacterized protein n=1 Tax=Serendipita vermifera MAFF 305830 TaxID=933852 RepID=A0A0C3AMY9_SERVB|nr:hypothetical protein M408DRAFT_25840 [Serendipita vermifera MAFF 305830]